MTRSPRQSDPDAVRLSILTPAFNEASNLPTLYDRIVRTMGGVSGEWEWLIVDDHSRDDTFAVIEQLAMRDARVRGIRLARNSGSHVAITCGLHHVEGDAAVMMAADLQDPPETTITAMLDRWRRGAQVVWAVRRKRPGDRHHTAFAALYYWSMRHLVGMKDMPSQGADCFLLDRVVIDAFSRFGERNVSVLALITWIGFRQESVEYDKQPRASGRSGWTLRRKTKLVIDSVTAFSDLPIRLCAWSGFALLSAATAVGVTGALRLPSQTGVLMVLIGIMVALAGIHLVAVGVLGQYVWRALDEARHRPPYLIEALVGDGGTMRHIAVK